MKQAFKVLSVIGVLLFLIRIMTSRGNFKFRPDDTTDWILFGIPLIGFTGLFLIELRKSKINSESFKMRIERTEEFRGLIMLMDQAVMFLAQVKANSAMNSGPIERFLNQMQLSVGKLKNMDLEEIEKIWIWFAPTNDWDRLAGEEGADLGIQIFEITEKLRQQI